MTVMTMLCYDEDMYVELLVWFGLLALHCMCAGLGCGLL